ncbi:hypothetical protein [Persicitalea sp.]|uniref:hypothetical protein n=1 Tax=Persicitalea sp. TaxID=3100273 RepID=UPI003593E47B
MSLSVGDIFEGVYQLEERLLRDDNARNDRWRADDITAYRRAEVLIDTFDYPYDPQLYWYGKTEGLRKIGQSAEVDCRYFVWELNNSEFLTPIDTTNFQETDRQRIAELIDALPVAAHESILAEELPEFWRTESGELIVFYRKHEGIALTFQQKQEVKESWKKKFPAVHQMPTDEDLTDPLTTPQDVTPVKTANASSTHWSLLALSVGIVSLLMVYQALPPKTSPVVTSFQHSLDQGIAEEKKGSYDSAIKHFQAAADAPEDNVTDARLDSLSRSYQALARQECARYRSAGSSELYFIPNQYFQYAAILARRDTPEICE